MEPTILILLPVYNEEKYLKEALDSLVDLNYGNWYCAIWDDASTDDTNKIALSYAESGNRFFLGQGAKNKGISYAINEAARYGIKRYNPDYVMIFSGDDKILPECLNIGLEKLKKTKADFVSFAYHCFGAEEFTIIPDYKDWKTLLRDSSNFSGFIMMRTEVWQALKGYSTYFTPIRKASIEDWDFTVRALKAGYKWAILADPYILHRRHPEQETWQNLPVFPELIKIMTDHNDK